MNAPVPSRQPPAATRPATTRPAATRPVLRLSEADLKRRRARSVAIAILLGVMVVFFYAVTIAKLGPQVLNRPL